TLHLDFETKLRNAMTSGTPKERWCNWKGGTTDWAGPLPSLEMVSSGIFFASPDQLRFRDPKAFFPGNVHNNISLWQQIMPGGRPKSDEILKYLELGVDVTNFFTPFKGIFQGKFYGHPTPPQAWFPNSKSCIPFDNFVTETILSRVSTGSLLVWGKVGDIEPLPLSCQSPWNRENHACATMRDKKAKFAALREDILGKKSVTLKPLQKFAGKINSFSLVIPAARLYVRKVYDAISKATVSPKAIKITDALRDEISHWRFLDSWEGFFPWPREEHCRLELPIFSDASNTGWGGVVHTPQEALKVSRYWNPVERKLPIVVKETLALRNTLKSTCSRLKGARIDCFIDNKTLLHCWENHGSRNVEVTDVLKQIYDISLTHHLSLNLQYIPSADNPADTPSRRLSDLDCTLSPLAWKQVQQAYGPHSIDLMAIPANVQSDPSGRPLRFFSPFPVDQAC
ncbi:hypothetical protein QZH41_016129, partial [Actinostola sp. cb2023]